MVKLRLLPCLVLMLLGTVFVIQPAFGSRASRQAEAVVSLAPMPAEVASNHLTVTVNGRSSPVMHAAAQYYLLNFDLKGAAQITVTADDPHYWDSGVEIQPMRLGIRPQRSGASISFRLDAPAKLSITRPGDFSAASEMLFLFANEPDRSGITAQTPGVRYYGPGIYHENIDAKSGDRIYVADGAVVFGSLNLWQVNDVSVGGRGTIIYDGPQNPNTDEGWMHKPNWHVIVMDNAHDIHIEGITCIVRSRTWMVQMRDSRGIFFRNIKVIGGSASNANQDGMDWLGGGGTLVQDSFFRAADDVFAMQGNWDGYDEAAITAPGREVSDVTVENSVLSTSISNVVRLGWPRKVFDSHGFTLRNSDVIQMGEGSCGIPFALFEIWADPAGKGEHTGIRLENIRLDHWYSLVQMQQPTPGIRDVGFADIWAMDGPGMVPSDLKGDVSQVSFTGVDLGSGEVLSDGDLPIRVEGGADEPHYGSGEVKAAFTYTFRQSRPGTKIKFSAEAPVPGVRYVWRFGDGDSAEGAVVQHIFPDSEGTLLDGSGRFRVLMLATDVSGHQAWSSQSVVIADKESPGTNVPHEGTGLVTVGNAKGSVEGFVSIPHAGGYTFTLLTSTTASLTIDGKRVESRKLQQQVCGSEGYAVQALRLSASLGRGLHHIAVVRGGEKENAENPDQPLLLWEGPGLPRQIIPQTALLHTGVDHP